MLAVPFSWLSWEPQKYGNHSFSRCSLLDQLRAFALDLGGSTLEEPTDLEIVVVDQNDNRPVFRQEVFTGQVLEGAIPGEVGAQPPCAHWFPQGRKTSAEGFWVDRKFRISL